MIEKMNTIQMLDEVDEGHNDVRHQQVRVFRPLPLHNQFHGHSEHCCGRGYIVSLRGRSGYHLGMLRVSKCIGQ